MNSGDLEKFQSKNKKKILLFVNISLFRSKNEIVLLLCEFFISIFEIRLVILIFIW